MPRRTVAPWPDGPVPIDTGTAECVIDPHTPGSVTLMVNGVPSSQLNLNDPRQLEFEYMQAMAQALAEYRPEPEPLTVLHLGAGGCAMANYLAATRPGSRQLAVEIDAALAALVRDWFDLPRAPHLRIRVAEAGAVLASRPDASADVIIRDVFAEDRTPPHLRTRQFMAQCARVLRPDGVLLANYADPAGLGPLRQEAAGAMAVFEDCAVIAEPSMLRGRRYGNAVIMAGAGLSATYEGLARRLRRLPIPARIVYAHELSRLTGQARPLEDL